MMVYTQHILFVYLGRHLERLSNMPKIPHLDSGRVEILN